MLGESMRRRRQGRTRRDTEAGPRRSRLRWDGPGQIDWPRWILGAVFAVALAFGIGYAIAARLLFPPPPESGNMVETPDLAGRTLADAQKTLTSRGLSLGERTAIPSADATEGTVVAQSSLAGQQLRPGSAVDVGVAAQPKQVTVPAVQGLGVDAAAAILQATGLNAERRTVDNDRPAGLVLRVQPAAGQPVDLPGPVTLFVSSGPPEAGGMLEPADTIRPAGARRVEGKDTVPTTGASGPQQR